jgi:hypothetical protein
MTEKTPSVTRRRRRAVIVPLLAVGMAAWAVRRHLAERHGLDEGWQPLPPAPRPVPVPVRPTPARPAPPAPSRADAPAAPAPATPPAAAPPPVAAPPSAMPPAFREPVEVPAAVPRARAVPTATAVAFVAADSRPDAPAGPDVPGALRALADGSSPDAAYTVKGKVATKVFHTPGGAYYTRTRADVWFRTADDARAAGFTERVRRHR